MNYNGKAIYEGDVSQGNVCRGNYLDSINTFIQKKYAESKSARDDFFADVVKNQEHYREAYLKMIGQPINPYPSDIPNAEMKHLGKDDFCDIYQLQIEVMPEFCFFGIFMVPFNEGKLPLVIAQHGGGGIPEACSDLLGENNYGHFTRKALERGMAVFAPQLLLWNFKLETGDKKVNVDIPYERSAINSKLRHLGLSITGLEVYCIRRSIDFLHSLKYIDKERTAMMGLSYGGYFSLYTAAADTRIKSVYAAGFFNDRTKINFEDWIYDGAASSFCDAEIAALCAPRRLQIDVGKADTVFDYVPSLDEGKRAATFYEQLGAGENFRFNLWDGGHRFDESGEGFKFFFDGI